MGKEHWIGAANPSQPVSPFRPPAQTLELAACPADQVGVNAAQSRMSSRPIEVTVVVDPALNARIVHLRQIVQGYIAVIFWQIPYATEQGIFSAEQGIFSR